MLEMALECFTSFRGGGLSAKHKAASPLDVFCLDRVEGPGSNGVPNTSGWSIGQDRLDVWVGGVECTAPLRVHHVGCMARGSMARGRMDRGGHALPGWVRCAPRD